MYFFLNTEWKLPLQTLVYFIHLFIVIHLHYSGKVLSHPSFLYIYFQVVLNNSFLIFERFLKVIFF